MVAKGKVLNTFRIFFDLQGYSMLEIPSAFLFDNSISFYLTDKNNEDMEGFNDVWANILNDDLLNAKEINNYGLDHRTSEGAALSSLPKHENSALETSVVDILMPKMIINEPKLHFG